MIRVNEPASRRKGAHQPGLLSPSDQWQDHELWLPGCRLLIRCVEQLEAKVASVGSGGH